VINFSCQQLYLQLYFPSYLFTCNTAENKNEDIFLIDFVNFGVAASYLGLPSVVKKFAYKATVDSKCLKLQLKRLNIKTKQQTLKCGTRKNCLAAMQQIRRKLAKVYILVRSIVFVKNYYVIDIYAKQNQN